MMRNSGDVDRIKNKLVELNEACYRSGISENDLRIYIAKAKNNIYSPADLLELKWHNLKITVASIFSLFAIIFVAWKCSCLYENFYGMRCLLPSNYLVWEATRPISDCDYCNGMSAPIILYNISRELFKEYAYSSKPIIVKGAVHHWKALAKFDYDLFKNLYKSTKGSYESIDDGCQFLNFKSDLFSLREVFEMPSDRAKNLPGEKPWYIGWGNCHPDILAVMRTYYSIPEFLPEDAEFPNAENIFFGYEIGAVMHLDYIPRLMWQGQVKGNKTWSLVPIPECEHICNAFEFYVEPGDIVLLDTRIWYHATRIPRGQFSLTVQSEYG